MLRSDTNSLHCRSAGLAFTELLITLLLSMMLIAGVLSVFTGGLRSADTVLVSEKLVLGGNNAISRLQSDLRQAGFAGCNSGLVSTESSPNWAVLAESSDQPWLRSVVQPVWGGSRQNLELSNMVDGAVLDPRLDASSDLVVVGFASGPAQRISAHSGVGATDGAELVTAAANNLQVGDIAFASRCDAGAIFKVDEISGAPSRTVRIARGAGNRHSDFGRDFTGADLYAWQQHAWYVASEVDGSRSLYRDDERVAEGVVQFLTEFGVDLSGDRQVDRYLPAADVSDWSRVMAVRVHLLLAADVSEPSEEPPQSLEFAGQRYVASDSRHYQSFTATVGLRNRLP